jgi:hypothetical protein
MGHMQVWNEKALTVFKVFANFRHANIFYRKRELAYLVARQICFPNLFQPSLSGTKQRHHISFKNCKNLAKISIEMSVF